jgi:hypothetical protein
MRVDRYEHQFQATFPDELGAGLLYISTEYDTTAHLCACGCGNVVVLPLDPTGWQFTYDGRAVTLSPSVGNWSFPCQSHYLIIDGDVVWSTRWTPKQIQAGRDFTNRQRAAGSEPELPTSPKEAAAPAGLFRRVITKVFGRG